MVFVGRYGLAPPLTRYLEMGGGAEGTPGRDEKKYKAFARRVVDQMCAVAMERAGLGWDTRGGDSGDVTGVGVGVGVASVGRKRAAVRRIWRRGKQLIGVGGEKPLEAGREGGGCVVLDEDAKEGISRLHRDVLQLQKNAWQVLAGGDGYWLL